MNQYINFQHSFKLETSCGLELYIRCRSNYAAFINRHPAGVGQYTGYEEYRAADCLRIPAGTLQGENMLAVVAFFQGQDSSTYRQGPIP